jgi:hypothetical protein
MNPNECLSFRNKENHNITDHGMLKLVQKNRKQSKKYNSYTIPLISCV